MITMEKTKSAQKLQELVKDEIKTLSTIKNGFYSGSTYTMNDMLEHTEKTLQYLIEDSKK